MGIGVVEEIETRKDPPFMPVSRPSRGNFGLAASGPGVKARASLRAGSAETAEQRRQPMAESVYRVTEVIGVSDESWEAGGSKCRPDRGQHRS